MGKPTESSDGVKGKFSVGTDRALRSDPETGGKENQAVVESSQIPEERSSQVSEEEQTLVEKMQKLGFKNNEKQRFEFDIRRVSQGASGYAGNPWKINKNCTRESACQLF